MAQVRMPQTGGSGLGKLTSLGQIGLGAATLGSGAGGLAAAGAGLGIAGGVSGLQSQASVQPQQVSAPQAIQRRLAQQQEPIDMMKKLQQAEAVLPDLPPEVRDEVGPVIFNASVQLANQIRRQQAQGSQFNLG